MTVGISAAVRAIYGLEPERVIADSSVLLDCLHPEDREEFEASLRNSAKDLAPWMLDFRIIDTAGKIHWMRGNSTPHRQQQGEVVWDGLLLDISDSMNAAEALKSRDRRFRALIEGSIQGVLVHRDNQVLFANKECARILGFKDLDDLPGGGSVEDHLHPDERDRLRHYGEARVRGDPVPKTYEARALRKDGSTVWLDVRATRVEWDGQPAVQTVFVDITERKLAEEELRRSEQRLRNLVDGSIQGLIVHVHTAPKFANQALADILGYDTAAEILRLESVDDLVHPDDRERILEFREARLRGREAPTIMELRAVRKDGAAVWVELRPTFIDWDGEQAIQSTVVDISERKRAEQELRESEERYRDMAEVSVDWFWEMDENLRFTYLSASLAVLGAEPADLVGRTREDLMGDRYDPDNPDEELLALRSRESFRGLERPSDVKPDRWVRVSGGPIFSADGAFRGYRGTSSEITEQKIQEDRLRHAQKMEAVGQLTGGVAHDFNNLLAVIMGHVELLGDRLEDDENARDNIEIVIRAMDNAAALTDRLLTFSRQQTLSPVATDVTVLIGGLEDMLQRTLGETIDLRVIGAEDLWPATIDAHQFENALVNLSINARDAMPKGGMLTIETAKVTLDRTYADQNEGVVPGDYVKVAVSDTGFGMSPEVLEKVFEPFFTTKDVGEGSGLGLSMVYGFVKQSDGHITIYSEIERGTTVKLYMPRSRTDVDTQHPTDDRQDFARGSEHVLVVEDDENVRNVPVNILRGQGYRIVEAANAKEAIEQLETGQSCDLLFADVVLPGGMNGIELAAEARRIRPDIKVLHTTGYAENAVMRQGELVPEVMMVNKPYRRAELLRKVRATLDGEKI